MKERNNFVIEKTFYIILIMLFIGLILFLSYYIYLNLPRDPQQLEVSTNPATQEPITTNVTQFYPNMKFNHNKITYSIDDKCDLNKITRIEKSFTRQLLSSTTTPNKYRIRTTSLLKWQQVLFSLLQS